MTRTLNDLQVDVESTFVLLDLVRAGDTRALDRLFSRYVNPLRRFAHGRLPAASRDMLDTNDLVQDTLVASLKHIDAFQPQREGALLAYLRQAVVNRVRDEARRKARRPMSATLDEQVEGADASPLDVAIGREAARPLRDGAAAAETGRTGGPDRTRGARYELRGSRGRRREAIRRRRAQGREPRAAPAGRRDASCRMSSPIAR